MRSLTVTELSTVAGADIAISEVYSVDQWKYMEQGAHFEAGLAAFASGTLSAVATYYIAGALSMSCIMPAAYVGLIVAESVYIYEYRNSELLPINQ